MNETVKEIVKELEENNIVYLGVDIEESVLDELIDKGYKVLKKRVKFDNVLDSVLYVDNKIVGYVVFKVSALSKIHFVDKFKWEEYKSRNNKDMKIISAEEYRNRIVVDENEWVKVINKIIEYNIETGKEYFELVDIPKVIIEELVEGGYVLLREVCEGTPEKLLEYVVCNSIDVAVKLLKDKKDELSISIENDTKVFIELRHKVIER